MPNITMKSTKEEIFKAFKDAEKLLSERTAIISTPEAESDKAMSQKVLEAAAADVESGVFSPELVEKFENLKAAIKLEEERLETCYGVKTELIDMTTAITAKKQAIMNLDAEVAQVVAAAEAEKMALREENVQLAEELKRTRAREAEEYEYNLKRTRQQELDEHEDRMSSLAKEQAAAEARLLALKEDAEKLLAMQSRLDGIEDELNDMFEKGREAGEKEAGKEYGYKTAMAQKDHAYELRERDSAIARLEDEVAEKSQKIALLEDKLDAAYAQLRELATKTVESSGGLKVISASADNGSSRK